MFESSHRFLPFDYHRVPYTVHGAGDSRPAIDGFGTLEQPGFGDDARVLRWPLVRAGEPVPEGLCAGEFRWGDRRIFGALLPDHSMEQRLHAARAWRRLETLHSDGGVQASVWASDTGDIVLPFDPDEILFNFWSERYLRTSAGGAGSRLTSVARRTYYRSRPLIPRAVQIRLRRGYSHIQSRPTFPAWPIEHSLHDTLDAVLGYAASVAGEPIPSIAPWPEGYSWAAVLTHDVETAAGRDSMWPVLELERERGFRSSWNFVPERYKVSERRLRYLRESGFEIGVHGLKHDGRDFESRRTFERRLPAIRRQADVWGAVGFRSPSTHRVWDWMERLRFDYDTSLPDTDPFEPQAGGCCSWLPFFNGSMVELPITLVQDHTMFVILGATSAEPWITKANAIRERGGMALVIVHPDYMTDGLRLSAYAEYLDLLASSADVWVALPRDVASWWRRRAVTSLVRSNAGEWICQGPAATAARVQLIECPDGDMSARPQQSQMHAIR